MIDLQIERSNSSPVDAAVTHPSDSSKFRYSPCTLLPSHNHLKHVHFLVITLPLDQ